VYEYTKNQDYSFAPFQGKEFLKDYKESRKKAIQKPITKNADLDIEAVISRSYLVFYDVTGNLKSLNSALKINDKICSKNKLTEHCCYALNLELKLISKLLEKEEIEL